MGRSLCRAGQYLSMGVSRFSFARLLVEPVPDHLGRPEPADLDALAAPPLLAVEDGVACPAHLALSGEADAPC